MDSNFNIEEYQKKLDNCKKLCRDFDNNVELIKLEEKYQAYIKKFSPAYLSGSPYYVGPSLIEYIKSRPINNTLLSCLFFLSHKLA